jgi:hypothetical protein
MFYNFLSLIKLRIKRIKTKYKKEILSNIILNFWNFIKINQNGTTILERGLPICGLRPNHLCEYWVSRW